MTAERNSLLGNAALLAQGTRASDRCADDFHKACVPEMALGLAVIMPYMAIMTVITHLMLCPCHSTWLL